MNKMLGKLLTLFIWFRYPRMPSSYRWFIRFRYLGKIVQTKYWIKDYIIKKPYKVVEFHGEFQQELLHVIPFAYWHCLNGTLKKTISSKWMRPFYFFSPNHQESGDTRDYMDNFSTEVPNAPHDLKLVKSKWMPVPYSEIFQNQTFVYPKPILVIANRYNSEWNNLPVSYFDLEQLELMIRSLQNKYQLIYNRPPANRITNDNSEVMELGDSELLARKFPNVLTIESLFNSNVDKYESFNEVQLMVYANTRKFISIHGGTAALASCFGGINIIYSKKGHEHFFREFENCFPELSEAKIRVAKDYQTLNAMINHEFISS